MWDSDHIYFDAFMSYTTRLWRDKVRAQFQVNGRNLQEGGRLQPVAAYPDGRKFAFRIIDPRVFIQRVVRSLTEPSSGMRFEGSLAKHQTLADPYADVELSYRAPSRLQRLSPASKMPGQPGGSASCPAKSRPA